MNSKQIQPEFEEAAEEIERTVKLAAAALDHPGLSEEEQDKLCDAELSNDGATMQKSSATP